MTDYTFGVTKVNGFASSDEALTIGLDFWTLNTGVNILSSATSGGTTNSQLALNKLIEIVSLQGQPVILNNPTSATAGTVVTYTMLFAIEHPGSWISAGTYTASPVLPASGPQTLINAIQIGGVNYGFGTDTLLAASVQTNVIP
jgi:hypothetical protein